jgi:hypothetical protein
MEDDSCPVCCETYNKSNRKVIACPHCSVNTCTACLKQYLTSIYGDPKCMHCSVGWNNDFMRKQFPSTWISKEYKEHREALLFDLEKARMPETQIHVENTRQRQKIVDKLREFRAQISEAKALVNKYTADYNALNTLLWRFDRYLEGHGANPLDFVAEADGLNLQNRQDIAIESAPQDEKEKRKFIMACPVTDCRGFLSTQWKCGICESKICKDCHVKKDVDEHGNIGQHTCDETIKASVQLMKSDSKACPQCGSMIFKIEGCNQMWCTQCNTAFDWRTGKIETGSVHNPHYFEWLRTHGGDVERAHVRGGPCGDYFCQGRTPYRTKTNKFSALFRLLRHIIEVEFPRYRDDAHVDANREVRIQYMLGLMSEQDFKSLLQKKEKERAKKANIFALLTMFVEVNDDILRSLYTNRDDARDYEKEIEEFRVYANECFRQIAKQYQGQTAFFIDKDFINIKMQKISSNEYKTAMADAAPLQVSPS